MSISRPSPRLRRLAASTGALALAGTLALSGVAGGGVEMSEAAWSDSEVAQATVKAAIPVPTDSWVRATANNFTNYSNYTPARTPTNFTENRFVDRPVTGPPVSRETIDTQINKYDVGDNFGIRTLGTRSDTSLKYCSQANKDPSPLLTATYTGCTDGSAFTPDYSMSRTQGFGTSGGFAHPAGGDILAVEARNVRTMAECSPTGASKALPPTAAATWGGGSGEPYGAGSGIGFLFANVLGVGSPDNDRYSYLPVPAPNKRITRWMKPLRTPSALVFQNGNVFFRATITSRQFATYGYALSDLYVTIDQYSEANPNTYTGSFTMVLSRSECGLTGSSFTHQKLASIFEPRWAPATSAPAYSTNTALVTSDAPLPKVDGSLSFPGNSDYSAVAASNYHPASGSNGLVGGGAGNEPFARGMRVDDAAAAELPPTTTVTSPLENSTASETTTSGPPNPSGEDESPAAGTSTAAATSTTRRTTTVTSEVPTVSAAPTSASTPPATQVTTSTSVAPAAVIPDEPGPLSPAARIEDVGIVEVDGEDLVVVVQGTSVPTGARTSLTPLERWINDGVEPSGDWRAFTSDEPERDGWRWAAINQTTGIVVYIR